MSQPSAAPKIAAAAAGVAAVVAVFSLTSGEAEGCPRFVPSNSPLVAHAGGGLRDRFYANNLEALNLAARHGHTLIELDFIERDGRLLLGHDEAQLSDLTLDGLIAWMDKHPGIAVVTDVKTDNLSGLRLIKAAAGHRLPRFIPQIYQPRHLQPVRSLGYSRIIFAERYRESPEWLPWVNQVDLWAVTIPKDKAKLASRIKHPVFLYTVNEPMNGVGLYTDCLMPSNARNGAAASGA